MSRMAGKAIVEYLKNKSRKTHKPASASTEELAEAIGVTVGQAYSRLWWMANKDETIEVHGGRGKNRTWRLTPGTPRVRKPKADEPETTETETIVAVEPTESCADVTLAE